MRPAPAIPNTPSPANRAGSADHPAPPDEPGPPSAGRTVGAALGAATAVATAPVRLAARARPLLGAMRIRKKLVILHTCFSLVMGAALLLSLRPAVRAVVREAEQHEAMLAMALLIGAPHVIERDPIDGVIWSVGDGALLGLDAEVIRAARLAPGVNIPIQGATRDGAPALLRFDEARGEFVRVGARLAGARAAVARVYLLLTAAMFGVYLLIALTLEVFVLPRQVYAPIGRMLDADAAVQAGNRERELIPNSRIPNDELGEIMRSRNESIVKLRRQEKALNHALDQLEIVAMELKRKNHLLEAAKRNLADQDRLASLGMMSAGLAHELNTPLAVLKGQVERLCQRPGEGVLPDNAALMLRVVERLERLSEGLLDFARVRPPAREACDARAIIDEAWTLVRLDREAAGARFVNDVPPASIAHADPSRLTQVFVNLLRNAVDATGAGGSIRAAAEETTREDRRWLSVTIEDDGPGIDPALLPRLFEPFTTTRLDARGTGLGLAVAEGIVREHGGIILVRNAAPATAGSRARGVGAVFEVMLPFGEAPPVARATGGDDRSVEEHAA